MKKMIIVAVVVCSYVGAFLACEIFDPNFFVGTWFKSTPYGSHDELTFHEDNTFDASYFKSDGTEEEIKGRYSVYSTHIVLDYDTVKHYLPYTMYKGMVQLDWRGEQKNWTRK